MIEILPPMGKYTYDTWRILPVKCYIDNFVRLRSCIWNVNSWVVGMAGSDGDRWRRGRAWRRGRGDDGPDMLGWRVSDREREKAQQWNMQARKESAFWRMHQGLSGRLARVGRRRPVRRGGPTWGELARLGRTQERIQMEIWFWISNEFGIWQDFEKFYKEILREFGHEDFS
jgi:hypothetical protein